MTTPDVPYRFELELTVPATPADVWQAIATADGISAWMVPTELDGRVGGAVTFHMGEDMSSTGRITAFEPDRRVAYEEDWATLAGHAGADVTPLVTEFLVEARSGGTCVVRVVTSAYGTGASWEEEFWGEMDSGWAPMLDNLRLHLEHFRGRRAETFQLDGALPGSPEQAMAAVRDALGAGAVGDPAHLCGQGAVVERTTPTHVTVRTQDPAPGLVSMTTWPGPDDTSVHAHGALYGDQAGARTAELRDGLHALLEQVAADTASRS
jgi:uncharacterized protein YndB with AHSA1/START domain